VLQYSMPAWLTSWVLQYHMPDWVTPGATVPCWSATVLYASLAHLLHEVGEDGNDL